MRPPYSWTALLCGVIALTLGLASGVIDVVNAQQRPAFTREEQRALRRGELVRRPETRDQAGMRWTGGSSWQRVQAPLSRVWQAVRNPDNYRRLIPGVEEARIVERGRTQYLIHLRHQISFVSASYYARVHVEEQTHTIHFLLDRSRPHSVQDGHGLLTLRRHGAQRTTVIWSVMAAPGSGLLVSLLGPAMNDWLLKVPWCVRGFIEPNRPHC